MCYTYDYSENRWINLDDIKATTKSDPYLKKISSMSKEEREKEFIIIKKGKLFLGINSDIFVIPNTFRLKLKDGSVYLVSDDNRHIMQINRQWIRNKEILKDLSEDISYVTHYMKLAMETAQRFFGGEERREELFKLYYNKLTTDQKLYYELYNNF